MDNDSFVYLDTSAIDKAIDMKIGARGLRSVMEGILTNVMFEIPSEYRVEKVIITKECVNGSEPPQKIRRPNPTISPEVINPT